jgi:NAD(P)-dependent dehydrogenase (short-subunit alcohol dehydrogenase family)
MDLSFKNKTSIVTGAGQGIGFEVARQLCAAGAAVVLNDIDTELSEKAASAIREEKGKCISVSGDTADLNCINQLIQTAVGEFSRLDIVIANAGITLFGDFLTYTPESFYRVMNVNLGGSFFLAQLAAKQMIKQATGGAILFTSSVTGHQAHKQLAAYGMTKAALEMLAKNLVIELSQHNITVNTVAPGATLTERTLDDPDYANVWSKLTPTGRPASTQDIASAMLFMVSDNARHITGQSLIVDGGWTSISPSPF